MHSRIEQSKDDWNSKSQQPLTCLQRDKKKLYEPINAIFTLKMVKPLRLPVMFSGQNHCVEKYKHNDEPIKCLWLDSFPTGTPHSSIVSATLQEADIRDSILSTENSSKLHEHFFLWDFSLVRLTYWTSNQSRARGAQWRLLGGCRSHWKALLLIN